MACITHTDILYRCPDCGQSMMMYRVWTAKTMYHMIFNLQGALRRRHKMKDTGNYIAKATEFAGWLESKNA